MGLPATPEDAKPFEGQGTKDGPMVVIFALLLFVKRFGLGTVDNGLSGPLD